MKIRRLLITNIITINYGRHRIHAAHLVEGSRYVAISAAWVHDSRLIDELTQALQAKII
jgi:hypothetical protein